MAIDTAAKRLSILDFGGLGGASFGIPFPSGTIGAGPRLHFLGLYSGIEGAAPPTIDLTDIPVCRTVMVSALDRTIVVPGSDATIKVRC